MNLILPAILWVSLSLVAYAYLGYPILVYVLSRLFGKIATPPEVAESDLPTVTLLISALNEEQVIGERVKNALEQQYPQSKFQIVIASDGSTDRTAVIVREYETKSPLQVKLFDFAERRGKATVLNSVLPTLESEVIVLSDANTFFAPDAIRHLARWFTREDVTAACGKLMLIDHVSGKNVDGLYWRYENFLKSCEGRLGALLGSNGAIYAVRRSHYVAIPGDTIIDDFMIPLLAKLKTRKQIVYDEEACATEETAPNVSDEFRRRCRIGAGGFQSMPRLGSLFLPTAGWTFFTFVSHKVLRWFCPIFLILAFVANLFLLATPLYQALFVAQCLFYGSAGLGMLVSGQMWHAKTLRLSTMFTSMNLALLFGLWRWLTRTQRGTWQRTSRDNSVSG